MDHDIDAELEWTLQVGRHEGVIANNPRSGAMCYFADLAQVSDNHYRICWRFEKHHFSVRLDRGFDIEHVGSIDKIKLEVVVREYASEETRSAAVRVIRNDNVLTGFYKAQRCIDRRHAGCEGETEASAFECRDISFERRSRRVLCACVFVTLILAECVLRVRR